MEIGKSDAARISLRLNIVFKTDDVFTLVGFSDSCNDGILMALVLIASSSRSQHSKLANVAANTGLHLQVVFHAHS